MEPLHIRRFEPADLGELLPMWRESFEHGVGISDPHPLEEQAAYFREKVLPDHRVHVAWQGGRLAAFCASNQDSIAQLYVRVGLIGQGIGSRLLGLAQDESAGSLWLYTFARNARARRFYERHGFVVVAQGFEPMWQLEDVKYQWSKSAAAV